MINDKIRICDIILGYDGTTRFEECTNKKGAEMNNFSQVLTICICTNKDLKTEIYQEYIKVSIFGTKTELIPKIIFGKRNTM